MRKSAGGTLSSLSRKISSTQKLAVHNRGKRGPDFKKKRRAMALFLSGTETKYNLRAKKEKRQARAQRARGQYPAKKEKRNNN